MTNTEKPKLIKLSASAMSTYKQCPKKYYFNYIARAKRKQWDHFDLGNLCHKTLELFHEMYIRDGTSKKPLNKMMQHAFSIARKEYKHMADELIEEAKHLLMIYLKRRQKFGMPNVKGVEASFEFNVDPDVIIRGFVDRLDVLDDGKFRIVDYKTTNNVKYLKKTQLLIYGLWLKHKYPEVESFSAAYVLLRHKSKLKKYDFNIVDLERTKKEIIDCASDIRSESEWAAIPTRLCDWCDFQKICPSQTTW